MANKTPEEMAEEWILDNRVDMLPHPCKSAFLAGYKAAKDKLANADKVMCNTTMEEIEAVDTGELMPITNLPTSVKWISVKDRLPEESVGWTMVYGCILSRWWIQPGFYDTERKEWISRFINEYEDEEGYSPFESVTHWMPRLIPPKEER